MTTLPKVKEQRLRLFQQRVQDLRECGVVTQGIVKLSVTYPLGRTEAKSDVPFEGFERDHFRSAMQTLRQFLMDEESVHFYSVCNIIWTNCDRQELKEWVKYTRAIWIQAHRLVFESARKCSMLKTLLI